MMAQSAKDSYLRYDVSSMTFSTDRENIGVLEFEARFDESVPKLFKQISYYKSNAEALKSKTQGSASDGFDIPAINYRQDQILDMVDYSNIQLSRSIEETSSLLSFIEEQSTATTEMGHALLHSLNKWLKNTQEQHRIMERDAAVLLAEMETYNFSSLLKMTKKLIHNLLKKLDETSEDFKTFRKFSKLIRKNLETFKLKKEQIFGFSKFVKNLDKNKALRGGETVHSSTGVFLALLSCVVILALVVILRRLGDNHRKQILG